MNGKQFCVSCGQKLEVNKGFLSRFRQEEPQYKEFEDGFYCVPCTKIKVADARKGQ